MEIFIAIHAEVLFEQTFMHKLALDSSILFKGPFVLTLNEI